MATTEPSPAATIRRLMERKDASRLLYVAVDLGLAELLGDGPRDSAALAAAAGADPDALRRVLPRCRDHRNRLLPRFCRQSVW